jgi:two-component system response regulator GlrR
MPQPTANETALGDDFHGIVGRAPAMRELFRQIELMSPLAACVLIEGERGVGKELVGRTLHRIGPRAERPFVCLDAADLSPALFSRELLGDVDGAFPSVHEHPYGLARAADGGTLFIEQVAELTPANQQHLHKLLESRAVLPVGSAGPSVPVDVRVVCTADRHRFEAALERGFDPELALKLRAFTLRVPSVAERGEDLPLLLQHFLRRSMVRYAKEVAGLAPEAEKLLLAHRWRGNVREIAEVIERAVVLTAAGEAVAPEVLLPALRSSAGEEMAGSAARRR